MMGLARRVVDGLEGPSVPFTSSLLTFFFALTLRNGIELYSNYPELPASRLAHFWLSYLSIAVISAVFLHLATRAPVEKVLKSVLPALIVICLGPIIDLAWTGGEGARLTYLPLPDVPSDLLIEYLTFFGPYRDQGVTPGVRIEIGVFVIGAFIYCQVKGAGILKGVVAAWLIYSFIFLQFALTIFLKWWYPSLGFEFTYTDTSVASIYVLSSLAGGLLLARFASRDYFQAFTRDLRWMRLVYYELLLFLGYYFDHRFRPVELDSGNLFDIAFAPIALLLAVLFAIVNNNVADERIDAVCNRERPLFRPEIDASVYGGTAKWFFLASLFVGLYAGFDALFAMLLFMSVYYMYSTPPFRFKRVPVLSKLAISINSVTVLILGYVLSGGKVEDVPGVVFLFFLVGFTFAANFIDLKDVEGDRAAGLKTLPVLLGMRRAQYVLAAAFAAIYLGVYLVIRDPVLIPAAAVFGGLEVFFLTRTKYRELPVFLVLNASILGFIVYVALLAPFDSLVALGELLPM